MPVTTIDRLIAISVVNGVAVTSTCLRLIHRAVSQRLWWDDVWAFVSLIFVTCQWVSTANLPPDGSHLWKVWRITYQVIYNFSLWTARLSLAVTIVRICPQGTMRNVSKWVAIMFSVCCVGLTIWRTIVCALIIDPTATCPYTIPGGAVETAFDVFADAWLIGAPIHMLCRMRLPTRHLRMLAAIFTLNILTSIACIVHAVFRQLLQIPEAIITGNVQSATSLLVCNLLVLITFLYRRIRGGEQATSISEISESVSHSRQHSIVAPPSVLSLQHRLPPGARIDMENASVLTTCAHCPMCRYLHEQLRQPPLPLRRSTPSLPRPPFPRRVNSKVALGKDPGRIPSEKSLNALFPCNCHLSPSSTFPDLPLCELHKDNNSARRRDPRHVPSEKSITDLYPCLCHLSTSSTFPDLPVCPDHGDDRRNRRKKKKKKHLSSSSQSDLSPGDDISLAIGSATSSQIQSIGSRGNNNNPTPEPENECCTTCQHHQHPETNSNE